MKIEREQDCGEAHGLLSVVRQRLFAGASKPSQRDREEIGEEAKEAILRGNAARFYRLAAA